MVIAVMNEIRRQLEIENSLLDQWLVWKADVEVLSTCHFSTEKVRLIALIFRIVNISAVRPLPFIQYFLAGCSRLLLP